MFVWDWTALKGGTEFASQASPSGLFSFQMILFSQGRPSSSSPCTQHCCLFKLHLILSPKMLRALSLEGLSHLKPSQSTSYLVWPSSVWPSESARLPLLISTACCCGFLHVFGVYRCACMTEHMVCFFLFPPPPQLFRRVAAALPGMDTTQDKSREDSILCVHTHVCVWVYVWGEAEEPVRAYTPEDSFADLLGGTENLFHHTFKDSPNIETLLKPANMQHWWSVLSPCIS